jgi:hypothetical protein
MTRLRNPWLRLGQEVWALGAESAAVMTLRTMKIAAGGAAAEAEAQRMVSEKVEAAQALGVMALTGALGFTAPGVVDKSIKHYRRKVSANRRRLTRG